MNSLFYVQNASIKNLYVREKVTPELLMLNMLLNARTILSIKATGLHCALKIMHNQALFQCVAFLWLLSLCLKRYKTWEKQQ